MRLWVVLKKKWNPITSQKMVAKTKQTQGVSSKNRRKKKKKPKLPGKRKAHKEKSNGIFPKMGLVKEGSGQNQIGKPRAEKRRRTRSSDHEEVQKRGRRR